MVGPIHSAAIGSEIPTNAVCLAFTGSAGVEVVATSLGLALSTDRGRSWAVHANSPIAEDVALSPRFDADGIMVAVQNGELIRSDDRGGSWQRSLVGSTVLTVESALGVSGEIVVIAGTENDGVFRSSDGGGNWSSVTPGLLDLVVIATAISPDFPVDKTMFLGTPSGLYRSRNGGLAWRRLSLGDGDQCVQSIAISPCYRSDGLVLVGTETDGLFLSRDKGKTWQQPEIAPGQNITAVAAGCDGHLAAATENGVALSFDFGATWQVSHVDLVPLVALSFVSDSTGNRSRLLAGPLSGGCVEVWSGHC
jgi:photosystem II stability/assembly factor-like uncharacterized protein